jgi:hypothetical protein
LERLRLLSAVLSLLPSDLPAENGDLGGSVAMFQVKVDEVVRQHLKSA